MTTPTPPTEAAPYLSPADAGEVWVLAYWRQPFTTTWCSRDPAAAIAKLADIVRRRWRTVAGRPVHGRYNAVPATAPEHDQAAVNVYFAALDGDREGYWLTRQRIYTRTLIPAGPEFVLGGVGDWTCVCGNDTTQDGFATCDPAGAYVEPDGRWDRIHYRCVTCGRIITQPDGQVVGRADGAVGPWSIDHAQCPAGAHRTQADPSRYELPDSPDNTLRCYTCKQPLYFCAVADQAEGADPYVHIDPAHEGACSA